MEKFKASVNVHKGPESIIQEAILKYLRERGWVCKETHGNAYQSGFPDVYATHATWRQRWIEVKVAERFSFTKAQLRDYPLMVANGSPIWIMTEATDAEYKKLFGPHNLHEFLAAYYDGQTNINVRRGGLR